ncbi:glycosyltransferase family 2 protein [Lactococcus garvieae]|uniref:glycosyltransferase family 2 protein n=1 Tax=Lactococcus garvieae TaxID=1363 RepID=UPI002549CDE1|nr:glycosyltransferase family 2 protein [Lactococcus garvieae]
MKKNGKYYVAGVLLIPGILGVVAYSSTYGTEDKKAGVKQEQVMSTPVTQVTGANIAALNVDSTTNNYSGISPAIGLTTFKDTYKELEADADTLHIHTKSHGNGTAALQAYRQEISIDSDIADEFFNTKDFQKYISGTVKRSKDSVLGGTKTMDIQKDLWDKSSLFNSETMNYDSKHKVIYYKTAQYTVQIASGIDIEVDMNIDLGQWAKDTGRLVERKPNYSITAKTDANSMAIGFTNKIVGSVSSDDILDSWIENPVEDTTLYYLTEKNSYFYGNGLQDEINEHPTDYDIELMVNGTPFKYIQMASEDGGTNSRGETIKKGDWDFDFGSYLNPGDVVTARVRGKEKYENINGIRPTKYSATTHASDATNIVSWEDWKVAEPSVPVLYEDDLIIPFHAPVQNQQLNRSYKLIVTVNDQEVYNKAVKDETDTNVPYLSGLVEGDVVKAKIVGSQPGEPDKESSEITTVVTSQDNEGYDDWEVQKAVINGPLYEGATVISGYVPIQNRAAGRTYDLKVYIGDELVIDDKDIDVALKAYNYSYSLTDLKDLKEGTLNYGDKIKAVVTGHQPNGENNVVYDDKSVESELTVSDNTGYASWEVNKPQLNKMVDTDTVITGNIGEQNIEAGRTYKVALSIDGGEPIYVKPKADGSFELKEVVLKEGSQVSATVIGSQDNREDKESGATVETVTDATNYDGWEVNKPTVNALKDTDTEITGNIGEQNKEFGRTYYLKEMNSQLIAHPEFTAVQGYLGMKNVASSITASGYAAVYFITNRAVQYANYRLGWNAAIGGTGFVLDTEYLAERGWNPRSYTEDFELQVELSMAGKKSGWNHFAIVHDEKPNSFIASHNQRTRWAQGHWFVAFSTTLKQIKTMFSSRSFGEFLSKLETLFYSYSMVRPIAFLMILIFSALDSRLFAYFPDLFSLLRFWVVIEILNFLILPTIYFVQEAEPYFEKKDGIVARILFYFRLIVAFIWNSLTYMLAQIVGFFTWFKPQNNWKKTAHSASFEK